MSPEVRCCSAADEAPKLTTVQARAGMLSLSRSSRCELRFLANHRIISNKAFRRRVLPELIASRVTGDACENAAWPQLIADGANLPSSSFVGVEAMSLYNRIQEQCGHLRAVHISLMVLTSAIALLVGEREFYETDVRSEVGQYISFLEELASNAGMPPSLERAAIEELHSGSLRIVGEEQLHVQINPLLHNLQLDSVYVDANELCRAGEINGSVSLASSRRSLELCRWTVELPRSVEIDANELKDHVPEELVFGRLVRVEFQRGSSSHPTAVDAHLGFQRPRRGGPVTNPENNFIIERTFIFPGRAEVDRLELRLPDNWFALAFPALNSVWDKAEGESPINLQAALEAEALNAATDRKIELVSIEVDGRNVGLIGPLLVVSVLVYMAAVLDGMYQQISSRSRAPGTVTVAGQATWVCLQQHTIARIISWASIAVAPVAVSYLALDRLAQLPQFMTLAITALAFAAALYLELRLHLIGSTVLAE